MTTSTWRHPEEDLPKVLIEVADPFAELPPEETSFIVMDLVRTAGAIREPPSPWDSTLPRPDR